MGANAAPARADASATWLSHDAVVALLVMFIVNMGMLMLQRLVSMFMNMTFGQM